MSTLFERYQALKREGVVQPKTEGFPGDMTMPRVLGKATTRFGLLIVRDDGACFPERGVFFGNDELGLLMDRDLSRQMVDATFRAKEAFGGEVIGCEAGSTGK